MQASSLYRAFSSWRARSSDKTAAKQRLFAAVVTLKHGQLLHCWSSWLDFVETRLVAKASTLSAVSHWNGHLALVCLGRWKEQTLTARAARRRGEGMLMRIMLMLQASSRSLQSLEIICEHCHISMTSEYKQEYTSGLADETLVWWLAT